MCVCVCVWGGGGGGGGVGGVATASPPPPPIFYPRNLLISMHAAQIAAITVYITFAPPPQIELLPTPMVSAATSSVSELSYIL